MKLPRIKKSFVIHLLTLLLGLLGGNTLPPLPLFESPTVPTLLPAGCPPPESGTAPH